MRPVAILGAICFTAAAFMPALPLSIARAAVPLAVDCRNSAFTAPVPGSTVAGAVEIRGKANVPDFRFYKVEYFSPARDDWVLIGQDVIRTAVQQEGRLVLWQTTTVPDGVYRLRLHVVDPSGNYCELFLQPIIVSNGQPPVTPSPTPLPTDTETPVLTAVPPQSTLTPRPSIITDVVPLRTPSIPSSNRGLPLPDINLLAFGAIFLLGACGMGSVVTVIFITSRLLNRNPKSEI